MISLKRYDLASDEFYQIIEDEADNLHIVPYEDFQIFQYGFKEAAKTLPEVDNWQKRDIVWDENNRLLIPEYLLEEYGLLEEASSYKQVIVNRMACATTDVGKSEASVKLIETITGSHAYNYIMDIVSKYYSDEEIDEIFDTHSEDYDMDNIQLHTPPTVIEDGVVNKYENCYKYDINGAHTKMVIELFPKAEDELRELYSKRLLNAANKIRIKQYFNLFVGMLCRKGHRGTYNWIVHRVTDIVRKARDSVFDIESSLIIYENTDCFAIQNPSKELQTSLELGEFKLESKGTMYTYLSNNYSVIQYENTKGNWELTGSCRLKARGPIDLRYGKVVSYKTIKSDISSARKVIDIKEEIVNVKGF